MPYSSGQGKAWAVTQVQTLDPEPRVIVDVGPGAGAWERLLRPMLGDTFFVGVEVWAPYVSRFGLCSRYDAVVVGDARWIDWRLIAEPAVDGVIDLVILGDVLEHMPRRDALDLWGRLRAVSRHLLLSVPVVEWPQGAEEGNPYEAHVDTWSADEVTCLLPGIVAYVVEPPIGAFLARGTV